MKGQTMIYELPKKDYILVAEKDCPGKYKQGQLVSRHRSFVTAEAARFKNKFCEFLRICRLEEGADYLKHDEFLCCSCLYWQETTRIKKQINEGASMDNVRCYLCGSKRIYDYKFKMAYVAERMKNERIAK